MVHEATSPHMNFHTKNFMYSTKKLEAFLQSIESGGNEYLRSLASEQPANNPAVLATDYPKLAHDFQLPKELQTASRNIHSAVLRISGPVTMWLHYDVSSYPEVRYDNLIASGHGQCALPNPRLQEINLIPPV